MNTRESEQMEFEWKGPNLRSCRLRDELGCETLYVLQRQEAGWTMHYARIPLSAPEMRRQRVVLEFQQYGPTCKGAHAAGLVALMHWSAFNELAFSPHDVRVPIGEPIRTTRLEE